MHQLPSLVDADNTHPIHSLRQTKSSNLYANLNSFIIIYGWNEIQRYQLSLSEVKANKENTLTL